MSLPYRYRSSFDMGIRLGRDIRPNKSSKDQLSTVVNLPRHSQGGPALSLWFEENPKGCIFRIREELKMPKATEKCVETTMSAERNTMGYEGQPPSPPHSITRPSSFVQGLTGSPPTKRQRTSSHEGIVALTVSNLTQNQRRSKQDQQQKIISLLEEALSIGSETESKGFRQ